MRSWLEVNLTKLRHNIDTVRAAIPENCRIIAVVKANAYGHGDVEISKSLEAMGVSNFAVACLSEGVKIRDAGISGDILVLSYVDPAEVLTAHEKNITLCAISEDYAKELSRIGVENGIKIKAHLKLNTGMNRVGFDCVSEEELEKIAAAYSLPGIEITGIFSHFSSSDDLSAGADDYTKMQLGRFERVMDFLAGRGIDPGLRHISNSGGIGKYPQARFDAVRSGALTYGYNTAMDAPMDVVPVAEWKTLVSCIRTLKAGDAVSYSRHYIAKGGEKIATICTGYADGYKRNLSGREDGPHSFVIINGKRCPIVGNICMDQMMVDVTGLDVKPGDVATLLCRELNADEIGEFAGSCMHDILSNIGPRVDRVYIK